ncbi:hypothetical protein [Nonomuraea guangzhouensis]|uniref:Uncharacterized protein n=1 Tax=Nonomuraea guangzhouensis TaxID=1291555 RepID=A0ABW4G5N1_9ACTN|nr:hypothetical protein [Nonomuraea guangzhouensis]
MLANETRRPYPHPYEVRSPSVRHVLPPSARPDIDDTQPASIPLQTIPLQSNPLQSIPTQVAADGGVPPQTPPELTARTVHRLRHIRQVSDQAISVIDQALHQVP